MKNFKIRKAVLFFQIVIIFIFNSCRTITTQTYEIATPKIHEDSSITIVLVSDLHSTIYKKDQAVLIQKIVDANPDLIILAGDIYDTTHPDTGAQLLLSGICNIAPVYFVTGNHEYWKGNIQATEDELESYGVIILSDTYKVIEINKNKIVLIGIEDPDSIYFASPGYEQKIIVEHMFRELDKISLYKILISHRPEIVKNFENYSFDLVLSGHTHGGQVRIPYIMNGLYARGQGLFPKYAGGLYVHKNYIHIIGRGLSLVYPNFPRIFNPPELVVIVIKPENFSDTDEFPK